MGNLINIFSDEKYSVENLSDSISKIIANPKDRTLWIMGMPYGNRFIPTNMMGVNQNDLPNNSEIFNDFDNNQALGDLSHAEGKSTQTTNEAEHACGKYNKSTKLSEGIPGTIFSIGTGTSDDNRKNAIEVTDDDKVYISGIGNYNGEGEIKDLSEVISDIYTTIENGNISGDVSKSILPDDYQTSDKTNEQLLLQPGNTVLEAFSKLEKAIIDNEQVFTNATESIAYSVGLDNELKYTPGMNITSSSGNVSDSIQLLDEYLTNQSSGADYAEMFEWEDNNENNEDRIGYFVQ